MSAVSSSPALLREAENFTLFIKNSISFPRFKVTRFVGKAGRNAGGSRRLLQLVSTCHLFHPALMLISFWRQKLGLGPWGGLPSVSKG